MWELDCEESWVPKNWCFWTAVLEKTLESPLDCKEIQPVHSEGDQPWDFFGRNDAKAETSVLWPPHVKSWLIGKDSNAGRDWGQVEKGTTEDEMAGWHHWLDGRESEWTPGVGDGQGGLVCCDSWGCKELDMTEWLIWSEQVFETLNTESSTAPALGLPNLDKPFTLYVHKRSEIVLGVLTPKLGLTQRVLAYFSKQLDSVGPGIAKLPAGSSSHRPVC